MLINWMSPVIEHRTYIQYHIPYTWKTPSWIEYLIPYSWTYAFTCWSWIPEYLIPYSWWLGVPIKVFKESARPSSHLTALHQLNSTIDDFRQFTSYFACWFDQSQLNTSIMRVCVINHNWTPPWECVWSIAIERLHELHADQLINWSIDQLRLLDLLTT